LKKTTFLFQFVCSASMLHEWSFRKHFSTPLSSEHNITGAGMARLGCGNLIISFFSPWNLTGSDIGALFMMDGAAKEKKITARMFLDSFFLFPPPRPTNRDVPDLQNRTLKSSMEGRGMQGRVRHLIQVE
jgi:hypothetical protein